MPSRPSDELRHDLAGEPPERRHEALLRQARTALRDGGPAMADIGGVAIDVRVVRVSGLDVLALASVLAPQPRLERGGSLELCTGEARGDRLEIRLSGQWRRLCGLAALAVADRLLAHVPVSTLIDPARSSTRSNHFALAVTHATLTCRPPGALSSDGDCLSLDPCQTRALLLS